MIVVVHLLVCIEWLLILFILLRTLGLSVCSYLSVVILMFVITLCYFPLCLVYFPRRGDTVISKASFSFSGGADTGDKSKCF